MDSTVVQSEEHEKDEHYPHTVASEQVTHGAEEDHLDNEKKSVLNKVKAKAKKIKNTIKKHGHQVLDLDRGRDYKNEDQHTLDDHDLDEDEDMDEDPQVHDTPINESDDVKTATPTSEEVEILGMSGTDYGCTRIMGEEPHQDAHAILGGVSSTTEIDQNLAKTFSVEEKTVPPHAPGSRPEAYTSPNYQTELADPSETGKDEIEEIKPVEESFAKMNVHDEPKPTTELNVQPTVVDSEYPLAENHDQFVPHLSAVTQTQYPSVEFHDQLSQETISTNINRNLENPTETGQTFNTIPTTVEEQLLDEANTDEVVSPKDVMASEVGLREEDDIKDKVVTKEEQQKSGDASNTSGSTLQSGKKIAHSLTQKLAPVYEKVAGVGGAVKSKVTGTTTGGVGTETKDGVKEQDKGVSVKDYLAEKLRPGDEDKALSEVISEALHKREEPVKKEDGNLDTGDEKMCEESFVKSPGKGVVGKLKGVVGSWFGKSEEKGGEDLSMNTNSGAEVEQVHQVTGENKSSSPIEEQGTR